MRLVAGGLDRRRLVVVGGGTGVTRSPGAEPLSRRERRALWWAAWRQARSATPALRWRLRAWRAPDPCLIAETVEAIRAATADPELWAIRDENELLARYAAAGFDVRALEDVGASVPLRVADGQAVARARPRGLIHQIRNRHRFRGRLTQEIEQLLSEALLPLVHNAAVYGFRAGAPEERPQALWVLAAALTIGPEERRRAQADPIEQLAAGLARAKGNTRMLTGLRPVFGEFNNWYITQVAQWSYWTYRERHIRSRTRGRSTLTH